MTIGERLQQHRKDLGLSQEELGQQLHVSRQTVSQWETDQTLPTVDNMLRLKELFGIPIDTLLCGTDSNEYLEERPSESYRFSFTGEETKEYYRYRVLSFLKRPILFIIISSIVCFLFLFRLYGISNDLKLGLVVLFAVLLIAFVIRFLLFRKSLKRALNETNDNTYQYDFYQNQFAVRIEQNGVLSSVSVIPFERIRRIVESGSLLLVTDEQTRLTYLFRKTDLDPKSVLFQMQHEPSSQKQFHKATGALGVLSIVSFILAIASLPISVLSINYSISDFSGIWKTVFFLPFPISSIIIGFVLKSKKLFYKKNLVAGTILTCIMATLSSLPLLVMLLFWTRK